MRRESLGNGLVADHVELQSLTGGRKLSKANEEPQQLGDHDKVST